jgi:hypothetical protein
MYPWHRAVNDTQSLVVRLGCQSVAAGPVVWSGTASKTAPLAFTGNAEPRYTLDGSPCYFTVSLRPVRGCNPKPVGSLLQPVSYRVWANTG